MSIDRIGITITIGWRTWRRFNTDSVKKRTRRQKLIDKYGGICQQCGVKTNLKDYTNIIRHGKKHKKIGPTFPTIEHIVPRCLNGNGEKNNITLLCSKCNGKNSVQNQREMITAILSGSL